MNTQQRIAGQCKCGRSLWFACPDTDGWSYKPCVNYTTADQIKFDHSSHENRDSICEACFEPEAECGCYPFGPVARARAGLPFGKLEVTK